MKNFITILCVPVFALFLTNCNSYTGYESCNEFIYIRNNSVTSVYFAYTMKDDFFNTNIKYNEILPDGKGIIRNTAEFQCWDQYISRTSGYIYIYIYDAALIESTPWDEAQKKYIQKYKLNVEQLIKMKWTLEYP